jgi:hypothetical protein
MEPEQPKAADKLPAHSRERLREILRWAEAKPQKVLEVFPNLSFAEQLSVLLLTSGQLRQDLILSSRFAPTLVPMLPEQEVYLTLKEIGLEDAVPMLSLMTQEQLRYVHDLEAWNKEHFEAKGFLKLLLIIRQCGEDKLADLLNTVDPEVLVLLLKECGRVSKFDLSNDPIEETERSPSMTYEGYYRYHPKRQELTPLLDPILRILKARHPERYGMIMESAYTDPPAEVEEEALRFRSSRMSEKGMPDFEEACEIYRKLPDQEFREGVFEPSTKTDPPTGVPLLYPIRWLPHDSFFREVLATLDDHPETDRIRAELATLGNKVLVAEGLEITSAEPLKFALHKVAGYLNLALEYLAGRDVNQAASWLTKTWLHHLFRLAYSQVQKLVDRARGTRDQTGFPWIDRFHYLVDSPLEETLRGLLRPRPLFFEGQKEADSLGFREFAGLDDLDLVAARMAAIEAIADLFVRHLGLAPETIKQTCLEGGLGDRLDTVKWTQVLHTLWVRGTLIGQRAFYPLLPAEVQQFIRQVFVTVPGSSAKGLDPQYTHALLRWSLDRTGSLEATTQVIIEGWIRSGAQRIEEELKDLGLESPVEGRFIQCLCVR